jgi:antitoxin component YwqK of YwqJK toxin-antitoxin module
MKITIVLCLILLSVYSYSQEVVTGPFFIRDGITYHQDTNEPVIGIIQSFFPNSSQIAERQTYRDGRRDGPSESFHKNGQLSERLNYIDGERDGLHENFDKYGNLTRTRTFRNGVWVETNENP